MRICAEAPAKQSKFTALHSFGCPLLSDADGAVATQFGVTREPLGKLMPVKRTTFAIDTDRRVLDAVASERSTDTPDKAWKNLRTRSPA